MPFQNLTISRILILVMAMLPGISLAKDWYATVGVASDYVWRGVTQTGGDAAASGGIEFVDYNYVYAGTWVSNTNHGINGAHASEVDLYVGVSGKSQETGFDVGYISYQYPGNTHLNFEEIYGAVSSGGLTAKISDSSSEGNYMEANFKFKLPGKRKVHMSLHFGRYNRDSDVDYHDTSLSIYVGELTITASETDLSSDEDKDMKVFMNWEHSIDF